MRQPRDEMSSPKRIAVVGAGPTGLSAIKACKEENVDVVCFERNAHIGGLWRYHDEDIDGVASVMKTTIINTNKELSAFSDFPPPDDYPNYMHHSMLYKYFLKYAENFDLMKHIRCNKEVTKVVQTEDFNETGRWRVTTKDSKSGETQTEVFDGVMVSIGHHVFPKTPEFPGQENFKGKLIHTHSLKNCEAFSGKRIVVVGIGNSGVDAAVDSAFVGEKVYLSTRRGSWIMSRVWDRGMCYDNVFSIRLNSLMSRFRSYDSICDSIERKLNQKFDHETFNLKPKHRILGAHPTTNDSLPNLILSGRVVLKRNIEKFTEDGVIFEGDNEETKADIVIFATGYHIKFPFLADELVSTKDNITHLYKYSVPPKLKRHTLCIIALIQPLGPIFPIGEMQSRWFLQIFTGKLKLPSLQDMEREIIDKRIANQKRYVNSTRHTIQTDFMPFLDELSEQFGAKPDMVRLAFTDPKLFWVCLTGPCLPYQFRIQGPHKWKGARSALINYEKRYRAPLNTRFKGQSSDKSNLSHQTLWMSIFILIFAIIIMWKFMFN